LAALSQAIEARDPYTRGHSERVSSLSQIVAARLGWKSARLGALRLGALLHDVGKLNLDASVLRKPGPLDEREYQEVQRHPQAGARLIRGVESLRPALPYVLFHHERWDGHGYPTGRSREQIPLGARIVAVVDAFDAMISARPYRPPLSTRDALHEVARCAGSQFDPDAAQALLDVCASDTLAAAS